MNRLLLTGIILLIFNLLAKADSSEIIGYSAKISRPPADTTDPVIFCPPSQIINLGNLQCDTVITFMVNAFDDQGQPPIIIQLDGFPSGYPYPVGLTVNTFLATDFAGNTATCSFSISIFEPNTQPNCADLTVVNLGPDCSRNLGPLDLLEGGPYGCPTNYYVEIDKTLPFGNGPWLPASLNINDVNQNYQARVTSLQNGARCWGDIHVRDNTPPTVICQNITVPCVLPLEQLSPLFLRDSFGIVAAEPVFSDACSNGMLSVSYVDTQQNLPCDDTTTISGIVRRTWSVTDVNGNTGTCQQIIYRKRLLSDVVIPPSKTASCTATSLPPATYGLPFILYNNRHYDITPASYCEFDIDYFDTLQTGACAGNSVIHRTWKIYDACLPLSSENPKIGVQNIQIQDVTGPVLHCPGDMIVTVVDNNCRGMVNLPDITLTDYCSEIGTLQAFWSDSSLTKTLNGTLQYISDSTGVDTLGIFGTVASFPIGTTTMLYVAHDACGNTGECSFKLTVTNATPPVAKCDSLLLVGLPTDGYLKVPAMVLDNGSTDDCSPVMFKAKLLEGNTCNPGLALTDTIFICCHNLGDTLLGTLRVYDVNVPPGAVANNFATGHFSDCAFKIRVAGSNPPTCTAPANITVDCENFDISLQSYGGLVSQSCSVDSVLMTTNLSQFDTLCARGTITRQFKVFSANGLMGSCSQRVVVNYLQDYYVRFPDDVILTMCDSTNVYGSPLFFGADCEMFGVTYTDERFDVVPDACFKIERTWQVINWCTYDSTAPLIVVPNPTPNAIPNHPDNLPGPVVSPIQAFGDPWKATLSKVNPTDQAPTNYAIYYAAAANGYQYKQIIKVIDTQDPVVESCPSDTLIVGDLSNNDAQLWNAQYWFDPVHVSLDLCEAATDLSLTATDQCSGNNVTIEYQLFLDLNGDNIRETLVKSTNLPPTNTIYFNNASGGLGETRQFDFRSVPANQKWGFAIQEVISGNKKTAYVRFNTQQTPGTYVVPQLPYGKHKIKWIIRDNCGNETICERVFIVVDTKKPTLLCQQGQLPATILPTGYTTLYDSDFFQYAEDNCTPTQFLVYGVRKAGYGTGFPTEPNGQPTNYVIFTCDEVSPQPQLVELWCRDRYGNASFCQSSVLVQDPSGNCNPTPFTVGGQVTTELQNGVEDVAINLEGTASALPPFSYLPADITDSTGLYQYPGALPPSSSLTLTPEYNANPLNGVTTYDLVLISKHILGIEPLSSPYKLIAADANQSNSVTTFDIVEIRKLILGIYQELPHSSSWRFVPASYVFPNPLNPFQSMFPEKITVPALQQSMFGLDFIGMKIGDVNDTATPNATSNADERSAGTVSLEVSGSREEVRAGDVFNVQFRATEAMLGCQLTLDYKDLEVLEIVPEENVSADNFALFPGKKALTMAWEKGGIAAFSLKCKANAAGNVREMFAISDRITKTEGYKPTTDNCLAQQRVNLNLKFPALNEFALFQNEPNPFDGATSIAFNLPEATEATIKVIDASGRVLFTKSANYAKGLQTVVIEKTSLNATGVLYYQLDTPKYSAVRKMIALL